MSGLQCMLDKCCDVATQLDLQFNVSKSHCIVFGELYRTRIIRHVTQRETGAVV